MFNPMMGMLFTGMKNNANPMQMLQQMAAGNPNISQVMNLVSGKNPQQLEEIARSMYKERGIDIDQAARQMGLKL